MKSVYIASDGPSRHKVGMSGDPTRRARELTGLAGRRVTMADAHEVPDALAVERMSHWLLRAAQLHGEWFAVDRATAQAAVAKAIEMIEAGDVLPVDDPEWTPFKRGPAAQDLEIILGRYPRGTKDRIARVLGPEAGKGAQADLLRQALDRELKRRERQRP